MFDGFSHDNIVKIKYCVRLNLNINIVDSIPFYFNFGQGHYFVLRVKQNIFGEVQIFQRNRVNPASLTEEKKSRNALSVRHHLKTFKAKQNT